MHDGHFAILDSRRTTAVARKRTSATDVCSISSPLRLQCYPSPESVRPRRTQHLRSRSRNDSALNPIPTRSLKYIGKVMHSSRLACLIPPHPSRAPITGTTTSPREAVRRTFFGTENSLFKNLGGSTETPPPAVEAGVVSPLPPGFSSVTNISPNACSSGLFMWAR